MCPLKCHITKESGETIDRVVHVMEMLTLKLTRQNHLVIDSLASFPEDTDYYSIKSVDMDNPSQPAVYQEVNVAEDQPYAIYFPFENVKGEFTWLPPEDPLS